MNKAYRKWKQIAVDKMGAVCNRCGFDDVRALQFDHINPAVGKSRRSSGLERVKDVLLFPMHFQLLCANCNYIKRVENREAPSLYA